jgi:hypothetical protein
MLAMDVNDNAGSLTPRVVPGLIASMLAPTKDPAIHAINHQTNCRSEHARDGRQR